jgi:hypothetical protein
MDVQSPKHLLFNHFGANYEEIRLFQYFFFRFLTQKEICYTHLAEFSKIGIQ